MPSRWVKRIVLLVAFTVMPLQGIAAVMSVVLCHGDAQMHAVHVPEQAAHDHGSHGDGHAHHGGDHDGGGAGNSASHHCCHLSFTAPAIVTLPSVLPDSSVRALAPDSLHDLYFPDQPQRPPLA